jgi:apolipoprotein D and lipocalin family protein
MKRLIALVLTAVSIGSLTAGPVAEAREFDPLPVRTVKSVDLNRYLGRWNNLAALPSPFLAGCERDITADYSLLDNGQVKVVNSCVRGGVAVPVEGRGRVVDNATNAKLEVTFAQQNGEFFFVPGGDYWIIGLDREYDWAVVGSPDRTSGFILSRTPTVTFGDVVRIYVSLIRSGYDPCAFEITPTTGGAQVPQSICRPGGLF